MHIIQCSYRVLGVLVKLCTGRGIMTAMQLDRLLLARAQSENPSYPWSSPTIGVLPDFSGSCPCCQVETLPIPWPSHCPSLPRHLSAEQFFDIIPVCVGSVHRTLRGADGEKVVGPIVFEPQVLAVHADHMPDPLKNCGMGKKDDGLSKSYRHVRRIPRYRYQPPGESPL
ncbi:unnamed protein product [Tuber aestivum]|uniref:Uncharacterized protein n=1 Tax=Tuber aestivum TaxID=59557 RepID=A0A292Q629_9PEZI|nr:unnamed protein product [Tuber aestivum]